MANSERKWIDNLLSHFDVPGVERTQRGSARRIAPVGIYHIALARQIATELDTTLKAAVALAATLLGSDGRAVHVFPGFSVHFDRPAFETAVDARIAEAVESIVPARRGRPRAAHTAAR